MVLFDQRALVQMQGAPREFGCLEIVGHHDQSLSAGAEFVEELEEEGEKRIKLALSASNHLGVAATGTATLAMPSRADGAVRPITGMKRPTMDPHPQIPDFAKAWLNREIQRLEGKLDAVTAAGRFQAYMISAMPSCLRLPMHTAWRARSRIIASNPP